MKTQQSDEASKGLHNGAQVNKYENLITIEELSTFTTLSTRMIFRLLKDEDFPRFKVRKRLMFDRRAVINYLTEKFGNNT